VIIQHFWGIVIKNTGEGDWTAMDIHKLIFYIHILGICFPVTLTYIFFVDIFTGQEIRLVTIVVMAFGYAVMIKINPVFHFLWDKWKNDLMRKNK
jgi:uncharacterized membrane protein YdjX (TVP38/TMEM64 family)